MRSILLLFALSLMGLLACKKNGGNDPDPTKNSETIRLNSADPMVYLPGFYSATYISWLGAYSPKVEGSPYDAIPHPATISGNYTLTVEQSASPDSPQLFISGSGHGPAFTTRTSLGRFKPTPLITTSTVSSSSGQEMISRFKLFDRHNRLNDDRVTGTRVTYSNNTVFGIRLTVVQVLDPKEPDYLQYIPQFSKGLAFPCEVGSFTFALRSLGIVKQ